MPNPTPSRIRMPYSMRHFRNMSHHNDPRVMVAHANQMVRDYIVKRDDFTGTLDSAMWTATNTGTSSAAPVFNAQAGGAARFVTGGGNPGVSTLYGTNAIFNSDD